MDDNSTWDDNDHDWDEISLNWETCYACFMWSDTNQKWQYSDIIWGEFAWNYTDKEWQYADIIWGELIWNHLDQKWQCSDIIWGEIYPCVEPCEPCEPCVPTGSVITDIGYNLAMPEVFFVQEEIPQKKKPVKKIKKIALTIKINSNRYREEKVKRDIDYMLKSVNIIEDTAQKVMKISIG